ncbi:MAG: SPFH/Band 7/PHB domain protein, partial [Propionibacteriaceae bacterium]|nr:SPFH/Band 7/PHB domain protein [Propionibacteriaceae bacterium]
MPDPIFLLLIVLAVVAVVGVALSIRVVQQMQVGIVQRLGKFHRTIEPGLHLIVPFIDRVRYTMDMREAVVPFPPQGVITEDNLMVGIDSVI